MRSVGCRLLLETGGFGWILALQSGLVVSGTLLAGISITAGTGRRLAPGGGLLSNLPRSPHSFSIGADFRTATDWFAERPLSSGPSHAGVAVEKSSSKPSAGGINPPVWWEELNCHNIVTLTPL